MARRSNGWRAVWVLAVVSLVNDVSGEMVMAVLPFLLVAQGAGGLGIGLVGGVTEGVGHLMKLAGGYLDQRVRRPLTAIAAGYLVAALSRVGVALGGAWGATLAFRSLDRVGKGLRTAPRDAMLAASVPRGERSRAFGLHRTADTAGAVVGVLLVLWGLHVGASESRIVLAGAVIGLTSVIPLLLLRGDGKPEPPAAGSEEPGSRKYAGFLAVTTLFYVGRVSYLFFILRAADGGLAAVGAVAGYLVFNIVYASGSYPAGWLADRYGPATVVGHGFILAAVASLAFAADPHPATVFGGFTVLGLSFAAVEGNARAVAASLAGSRKRSGRLGEFHGLTGFATLLGGVLAGVLWDQVSPAAAFLAGAAISLAAWLALLALRLPAGGKPTPVAAETEGGP